jgi:hypothetical protein
MISVIICSKSKTALDTLQININKTIGVEHDIMPIENSFGQIGICEAYNQGAKHARYPYLCFIHEDVKFIAADWGKNLLRHFQSEKKAGVFGVAGSTYKVRMVSSWWQPTLSTDESKRANYIQIYKFKQEQPKQVFYNPYNENRSKVVSLDGVFLAVKKEMWAQFKFDEQLLKGFHGYDMDFSLRIGSRYNNYVVYDILLEHFSEGINDQRWLKENYLVHLKNRKLLPVFKGEQIDRETLRAVEKSYLGKNFKLAVESSMQKGEIFKMFLRLIINSRLLKPNVPFLKLLMKKLVLR